MAHFADTGMEYRFLGNSGLKVSVLSYGGWVTVGGQIGHDISKNCLEAAWKSGCNYFDTAEAYAGGESEKVFGTALKELGWKRSDYVISTKLYWGGPGPNDKGTSRKHLIEGMDASLKRLQLDYVDIVFAHRCDYLTPMEETVRAFTKIIQDGKALYWGGSEWTAFQIEHAHHIADKYGLIAPIADQCQYHAFERQKLDGEYLPLYDLYKYGTTIWSPLAGGILTGKYNDGIPEGSRFAMKDDPMMKSFADRLATPEGKEKIEKVRKLTKIAEEIGSTTAQLALAFCIKNPHVSTVITGASKPEQVTENFKAMQVAKKIDDKILARIEEILGNKPEKLSLFGRWE